MRVLVTGGLGFIGDRIAAALAREGHQPVLASSRPAAARAPSRTHPAAEIITLDLLNGTTLARGLEGIDAVVNAAGGGVAALGQGAGKLFAACPGSGVRQLVHLSSMAVYGEAQGRLDETAPQSGSPTAYVEAKRAAEAAARDAGRSGTRVVILRPTIVYGPGSRQWTVRIARLLKSGRLGDLGAAGAGTANLIYVDDLAHAVALALRPGPGAADTTHVYNVSGPDTIDWNGYFRALSEALGLGRPKRVGERRLTLEAKLVHPLLKVAERARILRHADTISAEMLRNFAAGITIDTSRAAEHLGFTAAVAVPRGVRESAAWLRAEGLV